jgi:hypothetical protein
VRADLIAAVQVSFSEITPFTDPDDGVSTATVTIATNSDLGWDEQGGAFCLWTVSGGGGDDVVIEVPFDGQRSEWLQINVGLWEAGSSAFIAVELLDSEGNVLPDGAGMDGWGWDNWDCEIMWCRWEWENMTFDGCSAIMTCLFCDNVEIWESYNCILEFVGQDGCDEVYVCVTCDLEMRWLVCQNIDWNGEIVIREVGCETDCPDWCDCGWYDSWCQQTGECLDCGAEAWQTYVCGECVDCEWYNWYWDLDNWDCEEYWCRWDWENEERDGCDAIATCVVCQDVMVFENDWCVFVWVDDNGVCERSGTCINCGFVISWKNCWDMEFVGNDGCYEVYACIECGEEERRRFCENVTWSGEILMDQCCPGCPVICYELGTCDDCGEEALRHGDCGECDYCLGWYWDDEDSDGWWDDDWGWVTGGPGGNGEAAPEMPSMTTPNPPSGDGASPPPAADAAESEEDCCEDCVPAIGGADDCDDCDDCETCEDCGVCNGCECEITAGIGNVLVFDGGSNVVQSIDSRDTGVDVSTVVNAVLTFDIPDHECECDDETTDCVFVGLDMSISGIGLGQSEAFCYEVSNEVTIEIDNGVDWFVVSAGILNGLPGTVTVVFLGEDDEVVWPVMDYDTGEALEFELKDDKLTQDILDAIKESGVAATITLSSGLVITIDPATITDKAVADMDMRMVMGLADDGPGNVPADSVAIVPAQKGEFGMTLQFDISADLLKAFNLDGNLGLFKANDGIITRGGELVRVNDDDTVTIAISNGFAHVLAEIKIGNIMGDGKPGVADALAILRTLVGLPSIIDVSEIALEASLITEKSVEDGEPGVGDALAVLRFLVGLESPLDEVWGEDCDDDCDDDCCLVVTEDDDGDENEEECNEDDDCDCDDC